METKTIISIIGLIIVIIALSVYVTRKSNFDFISYLIGATVAVLFLKLGEVSSVTLKKSSDSEWEVSEKQMPDTTITRIVVLKGDTLYPTTQYLNVKIK